MAAMQIHFTEKTYSMFTVTQEVMKAALNIYFMHFVAGNVLSLLFLYHSSPEKYVICVISCSSRI